AGNRFRIVLRDFVGEAAQLERRVAAIAFAGVPNYFGPQRFGRDLGNLRGVFDDATADATADAAAPERGFELSALRSLLFNAVLAGLVSVAARRARQSRWQQFKFRGAGAR
ncbi:MAG: tRNA pseudouridine(13) synthase TruD, partial [Steroidobacteraceae bacterium]